MTVRETNGSIATGGTAVVAIPGNNDRLGMSYGNNSTAVLNFSATLTQVASATVGIPVQPGATFQFSGNNASGERGRVPAGPVTVWGATTGQAFYIAEASISGN